MMDATAPHRALRPLARAAGPRCWDAVVVIDDHVSMVIWERRVAEFVRLLRRGGAFSRVRVRRLEPDTLVLRGPDDGGMPAVPAGARAVSRQRFVFVVTDGAGTGWQSGSALPMLHGWALRRPVVIIHLLPTQQWRRTGVRPDRLRLRPQAVGVANARLDWQQPPDAVPRTPAAGAIPVPVLELRPHWLAAWANLVGAAQPDWVSLPAVLAVPAASDATAPVAADRSDPRQQVRAFISYATPTARALATHLAAVPLRRSVVALVRRELLPESDTSHLAEVINSGLLSPSTGPLPFEFAPGIREELLAIGRRGDTLLIWRALVTSLGATMPEVARVGRVLDDPDAVSLPDPTPANRPFLEVEQVVLRALSGRYLARSRELDERLRKASDLVRRSVRIGTPTYVESKVNAGSARSEGAGVSSTAPTEEATSTTPTAAPRTPVRTPAVWGNIPPRNPNFTGRTKLLSQLHEHVRGGTTAVLPHALHGMGGVGKSHLALQYIISIRVNTT